MYQYRLQLLQNVYADPVKDAGVNTEELLDIYKLFIRNIMEYGAVSFHSSLTVSQAIKV